MRTLSKPFIRKELEGGQVRWMRLGDLDRAYE